MSSANLTAKIVILILFCSAINYAQQDSVNSFNSNDTVFVMQKSPWGAVIRSAVIPGLGQIYNESYIKAGVIWGLGGWLVYNWIINNNNYKDYRKFYAETGDMRMKNYRTFYRDQRDLFTIYLGLTYLLNLVDAYVDAQLFDFTVEEDFLTNYPRFNLRIKLH